MKTFKKLFTTACLVAFAAVNSTAQTAWTDNTSNVYLNPLTGKVGIGTSSPTGKLHIVHDLASSGTSYGMYLTTNNTFSGDAPTHGIRSASTTGADNTGIHYGIVSVATNNNPTSTSSNYGIFSKVTSQNKGYVYGYWSEVNNTNTTSTANIYGMRATATSASNTTPVYGFVTVISGGSTLCGFSSAATNNSTTTTTATYGVRATVVSENKGVSYGYDADVNNTNTTSTADVYGIRTVSKSSSNASTVYGIHSTVSGGSKRWAGYFTGGDMYISGNVGINTTTPNAKVDIAAESENAIRIGKIGHTGNLNVPVGGLTTQYNIDFTGYRDVQQNQIGARIAALRFNAYNANSALVQKTGLAFYTNPSGTNGGTTDLQERMRIDPNGNIGIGITNPQTKLEVAGIIKATEIIANKITLNEQSTGSFQVKGSFDNFYPVVFKDSKWVSSAQGEPTTLELTRFYTHTDGQWRGSLCAKFTFHVVEWGNASHFINADIFQHKHDGEVIPFIAGWADLSGNNGDKQIVIWLRGGTTTYYYRSNGEQQPKIYDGVQNPTSFQNPGGGSYTLKTAVDKEVNSKGTNLQHNLYALGGNNYFKGSVGIGRPDPYYKLDVAGIIRAHEVKVNTNTGADFVFAEDYALRPLNEVSDFIQTNKHLPEIPSAADMVANGLDMGEFQIKLLQKIEELTLYVIEQDKQLKKQQEEINRLKSK